MSNLSKIEELCKIHCIVGFEMDVGYDFTQGNLTRPDASIKVFWEPQSEATTLNHDYFHQELTRAIEMYDSTMVHII